MLLVYIGFGIALIFNYSLFKSLDLSNGLRIGFGILLIVYAIIRFGRLINKKEDEV